MLREAAKKKFFSGPAPKALPPSSLVAIFFGDFFRASKKFFFLSGRAKKIFAASLRPRIKKDKMSKIDIYILTLKLSIKSAKDKLDFLYKAENEDKMFTYNTSICKDDNYIVYV